MAEITITVTDEQMAAMEATAKRRSTDEKKLAPEDLLMEKVEMVTRIQPKVPTPNPS